MPDNRVLLGKRGSEYGLWVSKPGAEVTTCDQEDMIFDSTNMDYGQTLARGYIAGDAGATNITVTVRDGVDPFVITRGLDYLTKKMSTRRSANANTQSFFSTGGDYVNVTVSTSGSSSTITITPQPDLEPDVAYIILQGDS